MFLKPLTLKICILWLYKYLVWISLYVILNLLLISCWNNNFLNAFLMPIFECIFSKAGSLKFWCEVLSLYVTTNEACPKLIFRKMCKNDVPNNWLYFSILAQVYTLFFLGVIWSSLHWDYLHLWCYKYSSVCFFLFSTGEFAIGYNLMSPMQDLVLILLIRKPHT